MPDSDSSNAKTERKASKTSQIQSVEVRLQAVELAQIDEWRRSQAGLPSRPIAIKRLVAMALQTERAPKLLDELREWAQNGGPTCEADISEATDHFIELVLKKYNRFSPEKRRWAKIYLIGHANQILGPAGLNQYYNYARKELEKRGLIYKTNRGRPPSQ